VCPDGVSPKDRLTVVEATLSLDDIAEALRISPADVVAKFQDPRVTSWFAEIWGERLFGYQKHLSSNHPGSDARIDLGAIGRFDISVRCFNKNTINRICVSPVHRPATSDARPTASFS
jgi:hypothetical protein